MDAQKARKATRLPDGMGVSTVTAARIFDGQSQGKLGEEHALAFEDFDNLALIKTYNTNAQVPDSAGTATAILSGYKTNIGAINVKPNVSVTKMALASCTLKNSPPTLVERAKKAGLSVGIISQRQRPARPAARQQSTGPVYREPYELRSGPRRCQRALSGGDDGAHN